MKEALHQKQREETARIKSEKIYEGKIIDLCKETLSYEDGTQHHFETVRHPGAVVILPVDEKDNIYLVQQWRRAIGKIILELPAGTLEKGESPLKCAQREVQEEVGMRGESWTSLGGFYSAPGFCDEYIYFFLATKLSASPLTRDDTEGIDVVKLPLSEALALVEGQEIVDVKTLYGILAYERWKKGML